MNFSAYNENLLLNIHDFWVKRVFWPHKQLYVVKIGIGLEVKVKSRYFECMDMMGRGQRHPYILVTTVTSDIVASGVTGLFL